MSFVLRNQSDKAVIYRHRLSSKDYASEKLLTNSLTLPLPEGEMKMTEWIFEGIRMSYIETDLQKPVTFDWNGNLDMIHMYFNLQGKFSILIKNMPTSISMTANRHNIFYGSEATGQIKLDELKMKAFMIQFSKDAFFRITDTGNDSIRRFADAVSAGNFASFSQNNLNIDLSILNCINSLINCRYPDSLKKMFYYSKTIEMLVLQAESLNNAQNIKHTYVKNDYDKERILFARDYLIKNIDMPPSLTELSRIAGINEFKLKRGFKEMFNQTVFDYLSDVRLEAAKNDLLDKRKSVTEIAFELGFSSLQHFSSAFKKKFGIPPSQAYQ